jgi:hypothetical protein
MTSAYPFRRYVTACMAVAILVVAALAAGSVRAEGAPVPDDPVHSDFNGDGYEDLAIGAPSERVNGYAQAGAVNVIYGGPNGLEAEGNQVFTQASPGISGVPQSRDFFGLSLAAGDFDGDGYADLAIGVPREDIDGNTDEGIVEILRGSSTGLEPWEKFSYAGAVFGAGRCQCRFGEALATGDFLDDGAADLAIGAPLMLHGLSQVGGILILDGEQGTGLSKGASIVFAGSHLRNAPIRPTETNLGAVLAAGDVDGDGDDDIVASSRMDGLLPGESDKRAVWLIKKRKTPGYDQTLRLDPFAVGSLDSGDGVGKALALGDFDGNGKDEIVLGAPYDDVSGATDAGSIVVLSDVQSRRQIGLSQSELANAAPNAGDQFGFSLAVGDFDADGVEDLAVGAPSENFSGSTNAGIVHVLYGSDGVGLTKFGAQIFHQDKPGLAGSAESGDALGFAVAAGRFGKSDAADLAIGIPEEALGSKEGAGAVAVLYGSTSKLSGTGSQFWSQDSTGIGEAASSNDSFGQTFAP